MLGYAWIKSKIVALRSTGKQAWKLILVNSIRVVASYEIF
jgi:hypothetical protein